MRNEEIVAVNFQKLMKGDLTQNVALQPNDVVLIPNVKDKKVFVLGEVSRPLVVAMRPPGLNVVEAVTMAGGFTRDAQSKNVLVVRGGLGDPQLLSVNVNEVAKEGEVAQNLQLQSGDIVYVPKTTYAHVVRFFQDISTILQPIVMFETALTLGPLAYSLLTTGATQQSIVVAPR